MSKTYRIEVVETERQMVDFLNLPRKIYKNNPYYVPDMDQDVRDMFDPKKNPGLKFAKTILFVAYDEQGNTVGRIAGIINDKANKKWNTQNVRFGNIEFIDDELVSKLLIDAVAQWGKEQGMNRIEGPMGITDFDKEGMLVEDFDKVSSMLTIYNHEYYPNHMTSLGFEKAVDWIQIYADIPEEMPDRFTRCAELVRSRFGLRVETYTKKELLDCQARRVFELLNKAYNPLYGFSELDADQIDMFARRYIPLTNPSIIPVVLDKDGNMIAAAITIGSLTKALQRSEGKLLPFGWFHLLKTLYLSHEDKVEMMLIAVAPEYQGKGVNTMLFEHLFTRYQELGYKWAEACPMLETNTKVLSQWINFNAKVYKRRRVWIKDI